MHLTLLRSIDKKLYVKIFEAVFDLISGLRITLSAVLFASPKGY